MLIIAYCSIPLLIIKCLEGYEDKTTWQQSHQTTFFGKFRGYLVNYIVSLRANCQGDRFKLQMFVEVYLIDGSSLRLPVTEGLTVEDICIHCCRVVGVCPVAQHLFALRKEDCELFCSPSEIVAQNTYHKYSFRVRFWPAVCNFSRIGTVALNYLYDQVRKDYVSGKIVEFEKQVLQSEALGLGVTAMYCHMKDNKMSMDSVLDLYKRFLPKAVRKNCHLTASTNSLRKSLKEVIMNPPEVLECKQMFLKKIAGTTYTRESYSVHVVEQTGEVSEHQLIIQPMDKHYPGLRLRSLKKKSAVGYENVIRMK